MHVLPVFSNILKISNFDKQMLLQAELGKGMCHMIYTFNWIFFWRGTNQWTGFYMIWTSDMREF